MASLIGKDIYVFVNSQSGLFSVNSIDNVTGTLVSHCKMVGILCSSCGYLRMLVFASMTLLTIKLAKEALNKTCIDSEVTMSLSRVKGVLTSRRRHWDYENIVKTIYIRSECMRHYDPYSRTLRSLVIYLRRHIGCSFILVWFVCV